MRSLWCGSEEMQREHGTHLTMAMLLCGRPGQKSYFKNILGLKKTISYPDSFRKPYSCWSEVPKELCYGLSETPPKSHHSLHTSLSQPPDRAGHPGFQAPGFQDPPFIPAAEGWIQPRLLLFHSNSPWEHLATEVRGQGLSSLGGLPSQARPFPRPSQHYLILDSIPTTDSPHNSVSSSSWQHQALQAHCRNVSWAIADSSTVPQV